MVKIQSAVDTVIETLTIGINNGTFPVGQSLPPQRELSRLFGVSMVAVREAIKVLEGRGIVISKQGSGSYVRRQANDFSSYESPDTVECNMQDIFDLARGVWAASVEQAVLHVPEEALREVRDHVLDIQEEYRKGASIHQLFIYESSFGMTLCRLSNNALAYRLLSELLKSTVDIDYAVIQSPNYGDILRIDEKIMEAILERNTERALFWGRERDLEIEAILAQQRPLANKTYRVSLHLNAAQPSRREEAGDSQPSAQ